MIVFGLNLSHDEACAAVVDGEVKVAIESERLTRLKHNVGRNDFGRSIPFAAINYCCDYLGIDTTRVDLWVVNSIHQTVKAHFRSQALGISKDKILTLGVPGHHLAHAYSAYLCSPFDEAAVVVVDTNGGYDYVDKVDSSSSLLGIAPGFRQENYSIYRGVDGRLEEVLKDWINPGEIGIGQLYMLYAAILQLSPKKRGYYGNDDALAAGGKLMGYAAHDLGRTKSPDLFPGGGEHLVVPINDFVRYCVANGFLTQSSLQIDWQNLWAHEIHRASPFAERTGDLRDPRYISLGGEAQRLIEEAILRVARIAHRETGLDRVCFAGGNALNITALTAVMEKGLFREIFTQPAANDAGNAIGAALYGYRSLGGTSRPYLNTGYSTFLGRDYSSEEISASIQKWLPDARFSVSRPDRIGQIETIADHIIAGYIVAMFRGRSEFGPRALGHRSLLATPMKGEMVGNLNELKGREWYRPVAPVVCEDDFEDYFEGPVSRIPYMTLSARVKDNAREVIPAVCHVDGTARVQTVTEKSDDFLYFLLKRLKEKSGVGVVVNTSFNFSGQPIVESPEEAIIGFIENNGVQSLVLGEYLLEKTSSGRDA